MVAPYDQREAVRVRIQSLQAKSKDLMFSIASGALVLSVTFRSSIAPATVQRREDLILAWLCFLACIIARVFDLLVESAVWLRFLRCNKTEEPRMPLLLLGITTFLVSAGFVGGVVALAVFAVANL